MAEPVSQQVTAEAGRHTCHTQNRNDRNVKEAADEGSESQLEIADAGRHTKNCNDRADAGPESQLETADAGPETQNQNVQEATDASNYPNVIIENCSNINFISHSK